MPVNKKPKGDKKQTEESPQPLDEVKAKRQSRAQKQELAEDPALEIDPPETEQGPEQEAPTQEGQVPEVAGSDPLEENTPPEGTEDDLGGLTGDDLLYAVDEMLSDDGDDEEVEELAMQIDADEDNSPFINCKKFDLLKIETKKERLFDFTCRADSAKISTDWNQGADQVEQTLFEKAFKQLGDFIFPQVFPGQDKLKLTSLERKSVQDKKKDPYTYIVVAAENASGLAGSTSKSHKVPTSKLADGFDELFNELQNRVHEELKNRRSKYVQGSIFEQENEEDID